MTIVNNTNATHNEHNSNTITVIIIIIIIMNDTQVFEGSLPAQVLA